MVSDSVTVPILHDEPTVREKSSSIRRTVMLLLLGLSAFLCTVVVVHKTKPDALNSFLGTPARSVLPREASRVGEDPAAIVPDAGKPNSKYAKWLKDNVAAAKQHYEDKAFLSLVALYDGTDLKTAGNIQILAGKIGTVTYKDLWRIQTEAGITAGGNLPETPYQVSTQLTRSKVDGALEDGQKKQLNQGILPSRAAGSGKSYMPTKAKPGHVHINGGSGGLAFYYDTDASGNTVAKIYDIAFKRGPGDSNAYTWTLAGLMDGMSTDPALLNGPFA